MAARMLQRVGHTAHYLTWNNTWSKFQVKVKKMFTCKSASGNQLSKEVLPISSVYFFLS